MRRRGFSLIEVLIACSILAVGMCAAVVLFPAALRNYRLSSALTSTAMFAKTKLNEVKALRSYEASSGTSGFVAWTTSFDGVTLGNVTMRRMTLRTAYRAAGTALDETFVTYLEG